MKKNKSQLASSEEDFLDERGGDEIFASNVHRYAATCFMAIGLMGFSKFFRDESKDELKHRTILEEFANKFNYELEMPSIPAVDFPTKGIDDLKKYVRAILIFIRDMELDLLKGYEKGINDESIRVAVKKLCYDMVQIQIDGVGSLNDMIAELDSTEVSDMNQNLLQG